MKIIGLAGTLNAGKDSLGVMLEERHGFLHISTSDLIREIKRRKFGDSPEALLQRNDPFINALRTEKGPGFLIEEAYALWREQRDTYPGGLIASGIRAIGEAEKVHELGGKIIFVDADPDVRYKRALARKRDSNDNLTFEEFLAAERSETDVDPNDKSVQNLGAMKAMADIVIDNGGSDIEVFKDEAEKLLAPYL